MEEQVIYFIDGLKTPLLDGIMHYISESYLPATAALILYLLHRKNNNIYPLITSLLLTLTAVTAIKTMVAEPRPCTELQIHFLECDSPLESFPSMHAALASVPLAFLPPNLPLYVAYLTYILLVGFTRVYLGVHYPHDAAAGILIGITIGYACLRIKPLLLAVIKKIARTLGAEKYLP